MGHAGRSKFDTATIYRTTQEGHVLMFLLAVQKMPRLTTIENMMRISQMVVQGLWDTKSPLLQLPHVTEDMLKYFSSKKVTLVSQNSIYLNLFSFKAKTVML